MTKEIELTQGYKALVDDEDYEYLSQFKWRYHGDGYAVGANKKVSYLNMHRIILERKLGRELTKDENTDHRDLDKLNNTRDNLRLATQSQNMANVSKHPNTSSRFKGVGWHKNTGKWQARITVKGKNTHLGLFYDEEEAAKVYDRQALLAFGEFAYLNFPELTS